MKQNKYSPQKFHNIRNTSKLAFIVLIILILIGAVIPDSGKRFYMAFLSLIFSAYFMVPGLAMFTVPWVAQAWLSALNSRILPNSPWEDLSVGKKTFVYVNSIFFLAGGIMILAFFLPYI